MYQFIYLANDDLDNFYKLLIAAAVISFVLGALWLALLGHGLLGDSQGSAGGITSTHVNHNVNYDANRVNYVKNSEILYANPPQTNSHIVQQVPVTTTTTYVNQAPINTYAQAPLNTYAQYPVTITYETKGYTVPQSADRLYWFGSFIHFYHHNYQNTLSSIHLIKEVLIDWLFDR